MYTSFNRHNVPVFFSKLEDVLQRHEHFRNGTRLQFGRNGNYHSSGNEKGTVPKRSKADKPVHQWGKGNIGHHVLCNLCCRVCFASSNGLPKSEIQTCHDQGCPSRNAWISYTIRLDEETIIRSSNEAFYQCNAEQY